MEGNNMLYSKQMTPEDFRLEMEDTDFTEEELLIIFLNDKSEYFNKETILRDWERYPTFRHVMDREGNFEHLRVGNKIMCSFSLNANKFSSLYLTSTGTVLGYLKNV